MLLFELFITSGWYYVVKVSAVKTVFRQFWERKSRKMRNLPHISVIHSDGCKCEQKNTCIDLKHWQGQANSDDLHALYVGEVSNDTPYQFHDVMFSLHYKDKSARFYRHEIITHFRELIAGTITVPQIQEQANKLSIITDVREQVQKGLI